MRLLVTFTPAFRLSLCLLAAALATGCGSNSAQDPVATAQKQEIDRLRQENQDLAHVRTETEEVQRLKKENQDLPKLRSQYQEAARLKKENDALRQQVTKLTPKSALGAGTAAAATDRAALAVTEPDQTKEKPKEASDEAAVNEGDEVLVEPKYLKALLPDFDWDKIERKEPLSIRAMVEKDGIVLTNVSQLHEYGITNFVIRRAQSPLPASNPPPQP